MFIEKMKIADLIDFANKSGFEFVSCEKNDKYIYLKSISKNYPNVQPEFYLTDFETSANYNYAFVKDSFRDKWRKFLYSKFGEQYKIAFRKYQHDKIDEYRIAIEKEIDILND